MTEDIYNSDLKNLCASVIMVLDPSLHGKAFAICGRNEDCHGIVLVRLGLTKKACGKTGTVNWKTRKPCNGDQ